MYFMLVLLSIHSLQHPQFRVLLKTTSEKQRNYPFCRSLMVRVPTAVWSDLSQCLRVALGLNWCVVRYPYVKSPNVESKHVVPGCS